MEDNSPLRVLVPSTHSTNLSWLFPTPVGSELGNRPDWGSIWKSATGSSLESFITAGVVGIVPLKSPTSIWESVTDYRISKDKIVWSSS
jgi:hypothetical protein